jgi:hypothetical protein
VEPPLARENGEQEYERDGEEESVRVLDRSESDGEPD